jgi:hypothetical protein
MQRNTFYLESLNYDYPSSTIRYKYRYDLGIAKYFDKENNFYATYSDSNLTAVPKSVLGIPLLAQLLPIAWFAGFDITLDDIDNDFYESIIQIRELFTSRHNLTDNKSNLIVSNITATPQRPDLNNALLLYSGGVDSTATFLAHLDDRPDIATILGADISVNDLNLWNHSQIMIQNSSILTGVNRFNITSNLRTFYSHNVFDLLKSRAWWGEVQHGLGLTGLLAPLAYLNRYKHVIISSSYSTNSNIIWGSSPDIDNLISFSGTKVIHDSFEKKRIQKIKFITDEVKTNNRSIILKVCLFKQEHSN